MANTRTSALVELHMARALAFGRLVIAWGTLAAFILFGEAWLADLASMVKSTALLFWLFVVILWCAFGVVEQADHLSELLGEPLGTLVLTLSIVTVEVALIAAVMLDSHAGPALGRDTMFAVLMIVLNGVVGLALLLGGLRHGEQSYNLQGAVAYLAIIVPLSVIALVLPSFILSTSDGTLTKTQSFFFSLFTILLYGVFLAVQTIRNRTFFVEPLAVAVAEPKDNLRKVRQVIAWEGWTTRSPAHRHDITDRAVGRTIGEADRPWNRRAKRSTGHGWCADCPDCIHA